MNKWNKILNKLIGVPTNRKLGKIAIGVYKKDKGNQQNNNGFPLPDTKSFGADYTKKTKNLHSFEDTSRAIKVRSFPLEKFDETLAQGFVKMVNTDRGLAVRMIDTYGNHTVDEENELVNQGYIQVGYKHSNEQEQIINIYNFLSSSSDKEWRGNFYHEASFEFLVMIIECLEKQQGKTIILSNVLNELTAFCADNKGKLGCEIYEELNSKSKTNTILLSDMSNLMLCKTYSHLKSLIIANLADKQE